MTVYLFRFKPEYSNLWDLGLGEKGYGVDKYPGKLPAQQVKNLLWFYTNEGDMVLDPFAGGGTTLDVCSEWKRQCHASDINPCRPDIHKRDIVTDGLPDITAKLIILDPPYATQKKGQYTDLSTDLSNMSLLEYYDAMENVGRECLRTLQPNGRVVLIISSLRLGGITYDLGLELYTRFMKLGFKLEERMIVPYEGASSMLGYWVNSAIKHGWMLRNYKDQFIFVREDFDPSKEKFTNQLVRFDLDAWFSGREKGEQRETAVFKDFLFNEVDVQKSKHSLLKAGDKTENLDEWFR